MESRRPVGMRNSRSRSTGTDAATRSPAPLRVVELFAGIGGFRLAADSLKLKTVWANDADRLACIVYGDRFGDIACADVRECLGDVPAHDLLTAGFPCQPFSSAGKKHGIRDPRGSLFESIVEILDRHRPRFFLLENVKRLLTMERGYHFATILASLAEIGYRVEWRLVNAKDLGLPQNRRAGADRRFGARSIASVSPTTRRRRPGNRSPPRIMVGGFPDVGDRRGRRVLRRRSADVRRRPAAAALGVGSRRRGLSMLAFDFTAVTQDPASARSQSAGEPVRRRRRDPEQPGRGARMGYIDLRHPRRGASTHDVDDEPALRTLPDQRPISAVDECRVCADPGVSRRPLPSGLAVRAISPLRQRGAAPARGMGAAAAAFHIAPGLPGTRCGRSRVVPDSSAFRPLSA